MFGLIDDPDIANIDPEYANIAKIPLQCCKIFSVNTMNIALLLLLSVISSTQSFLAVLFVKLFLDSNIFSMSPSLPKSFNVFLTSSTLSKKMIASIN